MSLETETARRSVPGVRTIDSEPRTGRRLKELLDRITHRGSSGEVEVNAEAPEIKEIMDDAAEMNVDVVLTPTGTNTSVVMGHGIAEHRRFVEIGVAAGLGAAALLGIGGIILRKRHHEPEKK
ncbi:MAG: hypothetical protein EXR52_04970 [Dehalococcoidia bacterium]|nr:hypothetical protein [Dehalococcoidia bacterium]